MGRVRCPDCTRPKPTPAGLKLLTASEKRRRDQAALSKTIQPAEIKLPPLPTVLVTTDRVLQRWGCEGSGWPSEDPDAYREALPPPLDPATFTEVNGIVMNAHRDAFAIDGLNDRRFALDAYRSRCPAYLLSQRWARSVRDLRRIRVDVLARFRERFLASRHGDLVALIRFIPEDVMDASGDTTTHAAVDCPPNLA